MIYGIGLPRTGTSSLAAALKTIGLVGEHYCVLHDRRTEIEKPSHFKVDNSFYKNYKRIVKENIDSKFILTTRNEDSWEKSIKTFKTHKDFPPIEDYKKKVVDLFEELGISRNLLILNIFENNNCWKDLCSFVNVPCSDYKELSFPHENKLDNAI